jgi:hypothetical protein
LTTSVTGDEEGPGVGRVGKVVTAVMAVAVKICVC